VDAIDDQEILRWANVAGLRLTQHETELGQLVWAWQPAGQPGPVPQFLTRREALDYLRARNGPITSRDLTPGQWTDASLDPLIPPLGKERSP
jgi:hypothetical protein